MCGELQGEILKEGQYIGPCPRGSVTELAAMRQHDHQPWPIFWTCCQQARLVGSMRYWRDSSNLLCAESVFHMRHRRRLSEDRFFAQIFVPKPIILEGAWMSLASNWADGRNYFHWVTDALTRLLIREKLPEETRILLPSRTSPYMIESIEMLGLSHLVSDVKASCVKPERYYFCSPTAMTGVWNPLGFSWLRSRYKPFFSLEKNSKLVFLTRRGGSRIPEQIYLIEAIFSEAGFEIIDCGELGFRQQIEVVSSAKAIAGIHGAAMTNILWAQPKTPILEIFQPAYLNACYEQIAFQGDLDYTSLILNDANVQIDIEKWLSIKR
jgi:capsular polysaccharide biosynthesis protein